MDFENMAMRVTASGMLNKSAVLDASASGLVKKAFLGWSEFQSPPESPEHVEQFVEAVREMLTRWESSISRHPDTE